MNLTFEKAMELTATVNCAGVYSDAALRGLWSAAINSPTVGNFVEIGCEYGRSTSLLAQVAKERNQYLVLIDPFVKHLDGKPGSHAAASVIRMLVDIDVEFCLLRGHSYKVPYDFGPIAFLHIDGNHSEAFLASDIQRFAPFLMDGGYVALHDYGNPDPYSKDVQRVVDRMMPKDCEVELADTCKIYCGGGVYSDYYTKGRP